MSVRIALVLFALLTASCAGDGATSTPDRGSGGSDGSLSFADGSAAAVDATVDAPPATDAMGTADGDADAASSGGDGSSPSVDGSADGSTPDSSVDSAPKLVTLTVARTGGPGIVSSIPAGISCGSACTLTLPAGTPITLTATGAVFCEWIGAACTGPSNTCAFTLTNNTSVTAIFGVIKFGVCP
ncbi:MAG: hypothetical protein KC503_16005 [Myxococcales bacterium]|nr:hypothetical protein [Myxococcales bacterium]